MINFVIIEEEFGEDWDIFQELFSEYKKSYEEMINAIEKSVKNNDGDKLFKAAHEFKGVVANFYCDKMTAHLIKLEGHARDGSFERAEEVIEILKSTNKEMIIEIEAHDQKRS